MATTKSSPSDINEIQERMAQIRRELHEDVRGAVKGARSLTDWRSQVASHPWLALGGALVLGYLIVPKRHQTTVVAVAPPPPPPPATAASEPPSKKKKWGLIGSALGLLAPIAVRAAQNYAIQYLEQWIATQPTGAGMPPGFGMFPGAPTPGAAPGHAPGPRPSQAPRPPGRPRDAR